MAAIRFFHEVLVDEEYSERKFFPNTRAAFKTVIQSVFRFNHNQIIDRRIAKLIQKFPDKRWSEVHSSDKVHHIYTCTARENAIRRMMKLKY
jgi:enoyl reductase-like protein